MFKALDPLLHQQLRLSIVSLLASVESADFNFLLEKTEATKGNLSVQISKLKEAGYVEVNKTFKNNYPLTTCNLTKAGLKAFEDHFEEIQE